MVVQPAAAARKTSDSSPPKSKVRVEAFLVPGYVAADHPQLLKGLELRQVNVLKVKKRQKSASTRDELISKYKRDLQRTWIEHHVCSPTWFNKEGVTLECKAIDIENLPSGFTQTGENKFQYNFTDPDCNSTKRFRPVAYRIPFLTDPGFYDTTMTVSHLCHNNWCYHWNHHVLESLAKNKARNGCPAGPSCRHKIKCLIPGIHSEG